MRALDFALSRILPEDLRRDSYDMSKKGVAELMTSLAREHPDSYREVSKKIGDLGRKNAFLSGFTIGPDDTQPVIETGSYYTRMDAELAALRAKNLPSEEFDTARNAIMQRYSDDIERDTMGAALKSNNSFARSVASGARGNPAHVKAILSTPGIYADAQGNIIPLFVRNSFASGVRPAETLAGTYGGRAAVISTKTCLLETTMVRMADGSERAIKDVKVGDVVVGVDTAGVTFPVRVVRTYDQGLQEVWRWELSFSNSSVTSAELMATDTHRALMTDTGPYAAARGRFQRGNGPRPDYATAHAAAVLPMVKLGVGRRKLVLPKGGRWGGRSEPWALLLGLMLGDGGTTGQVNSFSCADPTLISDVAGYVDALGIKITKRNEDPADYWHSVTTKNYTPHMNGGIQKGQQGFVGGAEVELNRVLRQHGMRGKYAWEKKLPPTVWGWDDRSVGSLIAAYFACDGSVYETRQTSGRRQVSMSLSSTSRELLEGVKTLLVVRFGIHSSNVDVRLKGGFESSQELRKHPLYIITIGRLECVKRFAAVLGPLVPGKKRQRMAHLTESYDLQQKNPNATMSLGGKTLMGLLPCRDIEVDHPDHLFLLANGVVVSNSTAKGGDWAKITNQSTSHYNVTEKDCGANNGLDFEPSDTSLRGRVLARDVAGLKAGDVIDKHALTKIRKQDKPVIARSPITCRAAHGLCARCAGLNADGNFPRIGESLGITAGQSVSEPVVQGSLNQKHNAGAAKSKKDFSGFDVISQFTQVPEEFKDKATVAEKDGTVTAIREAPQGGHYVTVDNVTHFVLPGFELMVKPGDSVEAGDQLADGLVNPSDIVRLRGLGEGRRYYADRLEKILQDSGQPPDRRNVELIARAVVDHVRVEDPDEDSGFLPDDLVREADFMRGYKPPEDTVSMPVNKATGLYLQQPVLHFTVGTRITPKIAERMRKAGASDVLASSTVPNFTPDMQRLRTASHSDRDWMSSLSTSYLSKQMTQSAERADETDIESNYHYAPRLAAGVGFGEKIEQTGKF